MSGAALGTFANPVLIEPAAPLDVDDAGHVVDPVWVGMEGASVSEQHRHTHRYPETLVPVQRVRVDGFTVALDLKLSLNPKAAQAGRRLFEQCCDAVKDVIAGRYPVPADRGGADAVHVGPPGVGRPSSDDGPSEPSVGGGAGAGQAPGPAPAHVAIRVNLAELAAIQHLLLLHGPGVVKPGILQSALGATNSALAPFWKHMVPARDILIDKDVV